MGIKSSSKNRNKTFMTIKVEQKLRINQEINCETYKVCFII